MTKFITPTPGMLDHYEKRTQKHIGLVKNNMLKLEGFLGFSKEDLLKRAEDHDKDKYSEDLRTPYIWITEYHRVKNTGETLTEDLKDMYNLAQEFSKTHVERNRHHPESHSDINAMTDMDILEMVCDWTAMSQELYQDDGSARGWAGKNVGKKWKFSPDKNEIIYEIITELDHRNKEANKEAALDPYYHLFN